MFDTGPSDAAAAGVSVWVAHYPLLEELGVALRFHGTSTATLPGRRIRFSGCPDDSGLVIAHRAQWRVDLRGSRQKRRYLDGDDAAGRADDGHALVTWILARWRGLPSKPGQSFEIWSVWLTKNLACWGSPISADLRTLESTARGESAGAAGDKNLCAPHCTAYRRTAASLHRTTGWCLPRDWQNSTLIRRLSNRTSQVFGLILDETATPCTAAR